MIEVRSQFPDALKLMTRPPIFARYLGLVR